MNTTSKFNFNDTYFDKLPVSIAALMRVNSIVIVLINSMVFVCLIFKRNSVPNVYWMQLMCLSLNDVIAGLSSFIVSLLDLDIFTKSLVLCCGTIAFFLSSQASTLYGILTIGVVRILILRKARYKGLQRKWKLHHILIFCLVTLSFSFLMCLLPFLIWARRDNRYIQHGCAMETLFGGSLALASKSLVATFFVPLMTTNILYCIVLALLMNVRNKVIPRKRDMDTANQHCGTIGLHQNTRQADTRSIKEYKNNIKNNSNNGMLSRPELREYSREMHDQPYHIESSLDEQCPSNDLGSATTRIDQNNQGALVDDTDKRNIYVASTSQLTGPEGNTVLNSTQFSTPVKVRKAYTLLGFIILFLNLFSWPAVIILMMEGTSDSWTLTRASKFPIFTTISCNSLVNPILYAIQVAEFRRALKSLFVDCARCVER